MQQSFAPAAATAGLRHWADRVRACVVLVLLLHSLPARAGDTVGAPIALELRPLDGPVFVVAGDEYTASFAALNGGDGILRFTLEISSSLLLPCEPRGLSDPHGAIVLLPGEQRVIRIAVRTDAGLQETVFHRLRIAARNADAGDESPASGPPPSASSSVTIVPRSKPGADPLRTLRVTTETSAVLRYDGDTDGSMQGTLKAAGTLDEAGRHELDLRLRKKRVPGQDPLFDPFDRYSLLYRNPWAELKLGDHSFSLSPLLAYEESGWGAQAALELSPVRIAGFWYRDSLIDEGPGSLGGTIGLTVPRPDPKGGPLYRANLGLLSPVEGLLLFGLWQQYTPADALSVQLDAALQAAPDGQLSPALLVLAQGDPGPLFYRARFLRAGPEYQGNYSDLQVLQFGGGLRLLDRSVTLQAGTILTDRNLRLDPLLSGATRTRQISAGAGWKAPAGGTQLDLGWENYRLEDRLPQADGGYSDHTVRFLWRQKLSPVAWGLTSSLGYRDYFSIDPDRWLYRCGLSLEHQPGEGILRQVSVDYEGRWYADGTRRRQAGWKAGVRRAWKKTTLELRLRNEFILEPSGETGLSAGAGGRLAHTFGKDFTLAAHGEAQLTRAEEGWDPRWNLALTAGLPADLPIGRRSGVAVLRGRVVRVPTGGPVRGVALRVNGLSQISGKRGEFAFHLPGPGTYYLEVDPGPGEEGLVAARPMPLEVSIGTGAPAYAEVGLVEAGTVAGRVAVDGAPGSLLLELACGDERRRLLTGPAGEFSFAGLRPGRYTLELIAGRLPGGGVLESQPLGFELLPGEKRWVEIRPVQALSAADDPAAAKSGHIRPI